MSTLKKRLQQLGLVLWIALSLIWLTGLTCESAVRINEAGEVVMGEEDFRALMADLESAETERDLLRAVLVAERESHDSFSSQVAALQKAFEAERHARKMEVAAEKRNKILWGVIGLGAGALLTN